MLNDKSEELIKIQQQCATQQTTIQKLKEDIEKADNIIKEVHFLLDYKLFIASNNLGTEIFPVLRLY